MGLATDELSIRQRTCQTCGMLLDDAGEYHPYEFCLLKRAGRDPWQAIERIARDLRLGAVPTRITIRELHADDALSTAEGKAS